MEYEIRSIYAELRKSEKKVADYVLANYEECRKISLEQLASRSGVSQPTVMRFVKALGFRGFTQFRYRVIEETVQNNMQRNEAYALYGYSVIPDEDIRQIPTRVAERSVRMIQDMLKCISGEEFARTISMIAGARRIVISAVENSSAAAKDLMIKLQYIGYDCRYDEDCYVQHITAASLTPEDVMIGISYSGQSKDTVDIMKTAKKAGAQTLCITNFSKSAINKWSDVSLCSSQEQWMYGDAIYSRSTQMVFNDMVYMGLITNDYEKCTHNLDKNSRIIMARGY